MSRSVKLFGLALLVLVALACGGGGGGGGDNGGGGNTDTGNTPTTFPFSGRFIEFYQGSTRRDPLNLTPGVYQLRVANFDAAGNRTFLTGSSWALTGGGSQVTLNQAGVLTVSGALSNRATITVNVTAAGAVRTVTADVFVPTQTHTVTGNVRPWGVEQTMRFVQVEFYNATGGFVGGSVTDGNGNFSARVPLTARSMSIKPSTLPSPTFYKMVYFGTQYYTTDSTCRIPLPTLAAGTNSLPHILRIPRQASGPPPTPNGCTPD